MSSDREPRRWQFEELMILKERGDEQEAAALFQKSLQLGPDLFDPLASFLIKQPNHPRIAILIELLGKLGDNRAQPILIRFLDIAVKELRFAAAVGLGWMRARAALEKLDVLEGFDTDEDVRREARIAIEEILRDFPTLRSKLKYHTRVSLPRQPIPVDDETAILLTRTPDGEERRRLVGMLPRLLALRYRAVPLGIGPGGVVAVAVRADLQEDPAERLRELIGHEVELHGWPLPCIYERILTFYAWGDDDWVQCSETLTEAARQEVCHVILDNILPEEPHPPLEDCSDCIEAIQSFLSIAAQCHYKAAYLALGPGEEDFEAIMLDAGGNSTDLGAPPPALRRRFLNAIRILAKLNVPGSTHGTRGSIQCLYPLEDERSSVIVTGKQEGDREILTLEFVRPENN